MNLEKYKGTSQFGSAYQYMLENDSHAPGSVDRLLFASMVRLCAETAEFVYSGFTPGRTRYRPGMRPSLDALVSFIVGRERDSEARVEAITAFTVTLKEKAGDKPIDELVFGGTEEEIIERGSDLCTDVARVGCALCQVAGVPARMVYLFDIGAAYSGHATIEAYRKGRWGAVDALCGVIYRHSDGRPASAWELMNDAALVRAHYRGRSTSYSVPEQFRSAGVANYFLAASDRYDYTAVGVNDYYREVLRMSDAGWPGGLRWLFGEDKLTAKEKEGS